MAVDDILIHPRERDLVIGTHGRSVYVLDDITPLERWGARARTDSVTFFPPRPATAYLTRTWGGLWGQRMFRAKNPAFGAYLDYFVARPGGDEVSLAVADSSGPARAPRGSTAWCGISRSSASAASRGPNGTTSRSSFRRPPTP